MTVPLGEANAGSPGSYTCRFPAMVETWRSYFGNQFNFYYVLLAAYDHGSNLYADIRQAQLSLLDKVPNTYAASAIDLGMCIEL